MRKCKLSSPIFEEPTIQSQRWEPAIQFILVVLYCSAYRFTTPVLILRFLNRGSVAPFEAILAALWLG